MAVLGSTSLTGCNSIPDFIAGGSLMLFQQTTAPTNWTKGTTHNNKALRVVTGTATPGGSTAFTSVFASRTPAGSVSVSGGTVGNHTLSTPQIPITLTRRAASIAPMQQVQRRPKHLCTQTEYKPTALVLSMAAAAVLTLTHSLLVLHHFQEAQWTLQFNMWI
jgi:hypothetical protein